MVTRGGYRLFTYVYDDQDGAAAASSTSYWARWMVSNPIEIRPRQSSRQSGLRRRGRNCECHSTVAT